MFTPTPLQIHTNEIPLGHLSYTEFDSLVVDRNVRPEYPDEEEAPQITAETWALAERCWVRDPRARPNISTVCETMEHLLGAHQRRQALKVTYSSLPCSNRMLILFTCCTHCLCCLRCFLSHRQPGTCWDHFKTHYYHRDKYHHHSARGKFIPSFF
jgi:hypothetical protein